MFLRSFKVFFYPPNLSMPIAIQFFNRFPPLFEAIVPLILENVTSPILIGQSSYD
jgi:hypothetical protein